MLRFFILLFFIGFTFSSAQNKNSYNIGILLDYKTVKLDPALEQLESQVKAVIGEDAHISFPRKSILVNNYSFQQASKQYQQLLSDDTDIILAFGVVNSMVLEEQQYFPKPTILFGAINEDLHSIDLSKSTSGIDNFTYLVDSQSFIDDLKALKELSGFKTVGIVIESPIADLLSLEEVFDRELKKADANYKLIPFEGVSDIISGLSGIDAVYMAGGFFLTEKELSELADIFIQKKLPSFTINGIDHVSQGIMATRQSESDFAQFMRRLALTIEGYINGTPLSEMPVYIEFSPRLTLNFNTADAIGIPIKYSLINHTDFIGEPKDLNAVKTYDLQSVVVQALKKNLSLESSRKSVEISQQNTRKAKSNYLPSINGAANGVYVDPRLAEMSNGQSPEFSTSGSITLQQTIFSVAANANLSIQKKLKEAQLESYHADQLNAVLSASNAYFNALILKANVQIRMRNLDLTKRNLSIAKQNFEAGQSGKSDVLRFRSELAQNTQTMVEAINQLEQGFIGLNQVLNNPIDLNINVEDVELDKGLYQEFHIQQLTELLDNPTTREPFIAFLIEEAKKNAPELKSLDYNLKATERNIKLSGSDRFIPTVSLQGQYNHTFSRSGKGSSPPMGMRLLDENYNIGLNVSLPVFNRNQNNIDKQIAIIQKEQIEINRNNSELNIAVNVRNNVLNLINQISNIELSRVSEQTASASLELTQSAYQEGAVNFIQLIDAQNNYLNAQLAKANAVYGFFISALQLQRSTGHFFILHTPDENDLFRQRFQEFLLASNR